MNKLHKAFALILLAFFIFLSQISFAQQDLVTPFKLWLLNNEARMLSSLSSDEVIINRMSLPFSFMPPAPPKMGKAEEKFWETHRNIYTILDEIQQTYNIARRYGNGRLAIIIKQARPEVWSIIPLQLNGVQAAIIPVTENRMIFHSTLLLSLQLQPQRDLSLSGRLNKAISRLSDEENRLFNEYMSNFSALYPNDQSVSAIKSFIQTAERREIATGLQELLRTPFNATVLQASFAEKQQIDEDNYDPLAELAKLAELTQPRETEENLPVEEPEAEIATEEEGELAEQAPTPTTLEPPPPGTEDLFNIWD